MQLCNPFLWTSRWYCLWQRPQFTSRVWTAFFRFLNVNISLTSGYHPESNGQTERFNQEVTRFLRSYCHRNQADWSRYLFWAEYAQNSLRKTSTGLTPFQCVLGFQPPLFPWSGEPSELPAVNNWSHGPPCLIIDGEEAYQVQEILDSRRRGGVLQYLFDWDGYGPEVRSWVDAKDILDPSLTTDFQRSHPNKPVPRPRGRPRCR